ncbi:MAG: hypothetical protein NVS3B20_10900 [Polyangiales bacterium]
MALHFRTLFIFSALAAVGCSSAPNESESSPSGATSSADSISALDDPGNLLRNGSRRLADLITEKDVGQTFGVDDRHVPYPDTYWPYYGGGIDHQWNAPELSPLEKFMTVADPSHLAAAKSWEDSNHGKSLPGAADWFGHCPGWTGAAISNPPLLHSVSVKSNGLGGFAACALGQPGCVKFDIGDINALEAESYIDAKAVMIGALCNTSPSHIKRDADGRVSRDVNGAGCKGLNPGALMMVLGNRLKRDHLAVAIDAQQPFTTDQIWNQPAYRYKVYRYETLLESEAANLVAHDTKTGARQHYQWNPAAKGFVFVNIGIKWVREQGPNKVPVSGLDSTEEMRFSAVIELDSAPTLPGAHVIGGEYINDPEAGADRLRVPPFVWIALDSGPDNLPTTVTGNSHNPHVQPSLVKKLVALAATR